MTMKGEANHLGPFLPKLVKVFKQYQELWKSVDKWIPQLEKLKAAVIKMGEDKSVQKKWVDNFLGALNVITKAHLIHGECIQSRIEILEKEVKKYEVYGGKFEGVPAEILELLVIQALDLGIMRNESLEIWEPFYNYLTSNTNVPDFSKVTPYLERKVELARDRLKYFNKHETFLNSLWKKLSSKDRKMIESMMEI